MKEKIEARIEELQKEFNAAAEALRRTEERKTQLHVAIIGIQKAIEELKAMLVEKPPEIEEPK